MVEFIQEFLIDKALVLIPCLLIIGAILKNTPVLPNWVIPYIMLGLGIIGGIAIIGFSAEGFVQGILVAGTAVFAHQLVKNTCEGIEVNKFKVDKGEGKGE